MAMGSWDIHEYGKWIARCVRWIEQSDLPQENKQLLLDFDRACVVEGLSVPRRAKLLRHMVAVAREFLPKPFTQVTKADLYQALGLLEAREGYSPHTKHDVKVAIRKFFKWLAWREEAFTRPGYPELVAWIKPAMKRKPSDGVQPGDLLTPEEVERLLRACTHPRNRAIFALLYELGARIGEVGGMRVGDVTRDEYSFLADLDGKTGKRTVRVVLYAGHLVAWLNLHPAREDRAAPLWPNLRPNARGRPLRHHEYLAILKRAAEAAGIQKCVYPHLLRHSRATHILAAGQMNEAQAKVFFGWVPHSRILSTYAHLVARDANDAVLRMYGVQKREAPAQPARLCGMCAAPNPMDSAFCFRCGYALSAEGAQDAGQRRDRAEQLLEAFLAKPEVRELFKQMLREHERDGPGGPPPPAPPPAPPSAAQPEP